MSPLVEGVLCLPAAPPGPAVARGRGGGHHDGMARRPMARELETAAARRRPGSHAPAPPPGELAAMLVRRGLAPRSTAPDLPFPADLAESRQDQLRERLAHYAFRLFLRGAILRPDGFSPGETTRYLDAERLRPMAEELVSLGLAARAGRGRYRLVHPARSFGGTLEWWLAGELSRRLGLLVAHGVRTGARGVGGDLDVVAAGEGKLIFLEAKSSPPKHLRPTEVGAFLRRVRAARPDVAIFAMDTALRLSDKILPMFAAALEREGRPAGIPRRVRREVWAITPHVYAVNAREDLVENVCTAVAEGLRALSPEPP